MTSRTDIKQIPDETAHSDTAPYRHLGARVYAGASTDQPERGLQRRMAQLSSTGPVIPFESS